MGVNVCMLPYLMGVLVFSIRPSPSSLAPAWEVSNGTPYGRYVLYHWKLNSALDRVGVHAEEQKEGEVIGVGMRGLRGYGSSSGLRGLLWALAVVTSCHTSSLEVTSVSWQSGL